ncbi:MAG: bis(5'-nucleosyl)-tetraphosphatase (symmetrical) YqeK [Bacillota bacterium]|jgi:predicted HD superfamily hydrolase involved in NAD metabolism|nr:bis(5'-nucleosyl)-tetraphosphatase (symmetrical) YqeK [Bacillota bacterium]
MKTLEEYKTLLWHKYLQSGNREILHRYLHSLAVVKKSEELIDRFSLPVDREKTLIAAALHDYAKFEKEERFLGLARKHGVYDEIIKISPKTWHALLGPFVLAEELGVDDPVIAGAVRWHTTGSLEMDLTAEIVFLADFIDDTRLEDYAKEAREAARHDFRKAIALKIKKKMKDLNDYSREQIDLYNKYAEVKWNY